VLDSQDEEEGKLQKKEAKETSYLFEGEDFLFKGQQKGINTNALRYFSTTKKSLPTFYYYKKRNLPLLHFLFSSKRMLDIKRQKDQEKGIT